MVLQSNDEAGWYEEHPSSPETGSEDPGQCDGKAAVTLPWLHFKGITDTEGNKAYFFKLTVNREGCRAESTEVEGWCLSKGPKLSSTSSLSSY